MDGTECKAKENIHNNKRKLKITQLHNFVLLLFLFGIQLFHQSLPFTLACNLFSVFSLIGLQFAFHSGSVVSGPDQSMNIDRWSENQLINKWQSITVS